MRVYVTYVYVYVTYVYVYVYVYLCVFKHVCGVRVIISSLYVTCVSGSLSLQSLAMYIHLSKGDCSKSSSWSM